MAEMRLAIVRKALEGHDIKYEYTEEDGCGSLDFMWRGLSYHVWEYNEDGWGCESNIFNSGRSEEFTGDYEEKLAAEIETWPFMIQ